jgi:hypothetical protein
MHHPDKVTLLGAPYRCPAVKKGDRAFCLLRDCDVVITGWHDGRFPWPRCRAIGSRGGSGLLVDEDLARAVRTESAEALKYWWGVSTKAAWHWRKALGIEQWGTPGSKRLHDELSRAGAEAIQQREFTAEEREERRRRAHALGLGKNLTPGYHGPRWTKKQIKMLGARPDAEVALLTGRTESAVRQKREELEIPQFRAAGDPWHWTPEEDAVVRTLPPKDAAAKTGRTLDAVYTRRHDLRVPDGRAYKGRP